MLYEVITKRAMFNDIRAFCDLSAEKYGISFGGSKGNLQLTSYDGKYRVLVAVNESISFDERLQVAKALIDECIVITSYSIHYTKLYDDSSNCCNSMFWIHRSYSISRRLGDFINKDFKNR